MFDSVKTRLAIIAGMIILSIVALWPRPVTRMTDGPNPHDTTYNEISLKKGLDLQGGIHLALELDESGGPVANRADAIDRALKVIRTRIDEFGVTEPLVQKEGANRIVVELAGISDPTRAKEIVKRSAFLQFQMLDKDNLFYRALRGMDRALASAGISEATIGRSLDTTRGARPAPAAPAGLDNLLQSGTDTAKAGRDTARTRRGAQADSAQADTAADTSNALLNGALSGLLNAGGMAGEFLVAEEKMQIVDQMLKQGVVQRLMPRGVVTHWAHETVSRGARTYRALYAVQERAVMNGEELVDAQARLDPIYNQAVVEFQLTRRGGRSFERETGRRVGDMMAVVLDGRVANRPAVIKGPIGQRGQIELSGSSLQEAQDLALVLKAGSLPAPLLIVEEHTIGPSLGADSIRKGMTAGIVGIVLVVLLVCTYYRLSGILACAALGLYALFTLGAMAAIGAPLTMPGIAGFALSVTMAVDANVLIFERIREELEAGKSIRLAVDAGFTMAMSAIIDSNVSMILTAALLFQFGTGPVKGFGVMLIVGVLASMITAVFVTRTFFMMLLARKQQTQTLSI